MWKVFTRPTCASDFFALKNRTKIKKEFEKIMLTSKVIPIFVFTAAILIFRGKKITFKYKES
jgi:hypothetical protein